MKKLFIVLLLLTICMPTFAAYQNVQERLAEKGFEYGEFDTLLKQTVVTLDTATAITATDIVSTYTEAVYMLPSTTFNDYPIKLRLQNHGTASITYVEYDAALTGLVLPTATASHLITPSGAAVVGGAVYEKTFYSAPNISIGASGNQEVIIEVWGRSR